MGLMGYDYVAPRITCRIERREAIRQRLHEAHEGVLLFLRQTKPPDSLRVHVGGRLRRRPAGRAFAGIIGPTTRQDVASIVEMHDGFQALEIPVVPVSFYKFRIGALVDVAQRRYSKTLSVVRL